jgi:TRAP-type C4-dicarboxylate transport system permease small subunit
MKRYFDNGIDFLLAVLLLAMTLAVFLQVFFRYVVNAPLSWPEEMARIMIVWLSFVGGYMAMRENKHLGFGLLVEKLPMALQGAVAVAGRIFVVIFLLVVVREGYTFAVTNIDVPMPYTDISTGIWVYSVFPIAGALMLAQSVLDAVREIGRLRAADPTAGKGRV